VPTDVSAHSNADVSIQPWAPGPLAPELLPGVVDVWRVDLADVGDDLAELLSTDERARAGRMTGDRKRALWARSRGVLREILGRYLKADPCELRFALGNAGKPALEDGPEATGAELAFNLSHSARIGLYAFTTAGPVGVDVEVRRRRLASLTIAARAFGPAEAARLRDLDPEAREREFLRGWVRHEAELKCLGAGLGGAQDGETAQWISGLEMGMRAAAAVAVAARPSELRCWDWSGAGQ
jgi:4'-phosphopantetheinyl transferase